jgi:hypothetical protein
MQPGLVAAHPGSAQGIAQYRVDRFAQAKRNIGTAFTSSQRNKTFTSAAAIFPWTSGRFGNCTATGPCWDYEYHIGGDIGLELANYWVASGDTDTFKRDLWPMYDATASLYSQLLDKNGSRYSLRNMTDPDEYANHVDNGGYTMALIATHLENANTFRSMFSETPNSTWNTQAQNVIIGRDTDSNVTLEFTGMNGTAVVKQADVILNTYPLGFHQNYTTTQALADLDYYANQQSTDGPAMTYAIFSVIANQLSPSGCSSYTYQQYGTQPYVRGPWFQFSEQMIDNWNLNGGTHPAFPFLTGHGGSLQVVLFGYLGFRLTPDSNLHVDPSLPPQIPQIRYRTFHWYGWPIQAFSNQTHTTLTRNSSSVPAEGAVPNTTYSSTPIPVVVGPAGSPPLLTYNLSQDSSITIPNRQIGLIPTTDNNIAQCLPVTSPDEFLPGQFPIAAVDGATSTKWQPALANKTASITVTIPQGYRVRSMAFNWAQVPPWNYTVLFHNDTLKNPSAVDIAGGNGVQSIAQNQTVKISNQYNVTALNSIRAVQDNITTFSVPSGQQIFTAKYATLRIWGSLASSKNSLRNMTGEGATVAEWAIIVDGLNATAGVEGPVKRSEDVGAEILGRLGHVGRMVGGGKYRGGRVI